MARPGRAPKSPENRQRRNAAPEFIELPRDGFEGKVPALPGSKDLDVRTRRWYRTWARSPQASQFAVTDWQRLHMLAPLVDAFWHSPTTDRLAEIRLQESKLGATAEDRQKLRWRVESEPEEPPAKPKGSRARKDPRHLKAV